MKTNLLLLIWEADSPLPELKGAFQIEESMSHIGKGEILDILEKRVDGFDLDIDDFNVEEITFEDFCSDYGHYSNPNRILLDSNILFKL